MISVIQHADLQYVSTLEPKYVIDLDKLDTMLNFDNNPGEDDQLNEEQTKLQQITSKWLTDEIKKNTELALKAEEKVQDSSFC